MSTTTRTFVALPIPNARAKKLGRLQGLIAPEIPGARWVEPANFHVTLAFLGDVTHADLDRVCRAVAGAASEFGPLQLRLEGLGVFPNPTRARTVWVGLGGDDVCRLLDLQRAIAEAVGAAGYPAEDDRFHPHVTLGRLKPGRGPSPDLSALLGHYRGWSAGGFEAAEVVTFASTLGAEGSNYAPLARAPLTG